jgi:hypothetical protein
MIKKYKLFTFVLFLFMPSLFANTFFSGYAGGKLNFSTVEDSEKYSPIINFQGFIKGQFNFSENLWSHCELSLDTDNLISESLLHGVDSKFRIDELSLIAKKRFEGKTNFYGTFIGTLDPIGTDVFLKRYFSIADISSKLTESWLGLEGSLLYSHFGIGISDVLRFNRKPMAAGIYLYANKDENDNNFINVDLRYACVYRYFTFDVACGLGIPTQFNNTFVQMMKESCLHAGLTTHIGNNYTNSLFLQMGMFNAPITSFASKQILSDTYFLIEPRFKFGDIRIHLSAYSLPQKTVDKLFFVDNSMGASVNLYSDAITFFPRRSTMGILASYSFPNKSVVELKDIKNIADWESEIIVTPYFSTGFLNGELHVQTKINFMKFAALKWYDAFTVDLGFKTSL